MAAGSSSRYLGEGGATESGPRGSARPPLPPPPYHRSSASSRPWGPARARSTAPRHSKTAAQRLGSSQLQSPPAAAISPRQARPRGRGVGARPGGRLSGDYKDHDGDYKDHDIDYKDDDDK